MPVAGAAKVDPGAPKAKRILLVGDSLSIGLGQQMETAFAGKPAVRFAHLGKVSSGLANPSFFDWEANLEAQVKAHHPDVVMIMLGANDDKPLPTPSGRSAPYKSTSWDAEYARRVARLHAIAKSENPAAAVYLIGVPIMGDAAFDAGMGHVNGVLAKTAASLPDCAYINVRDVLADASGAYAPVARTASGATVKLRADDGVHISAAGSRLLAARLIETVAEPSGLPRGELLAAIENRDLTPMARPGRPATPSVTAVAAAPTPAVVTVASAPVPAAAPAAPAAEKPAAPVAVAAAAVAAKPVAAPAVQVAQATAAPKAVAPAAAPAKIAAPAVPATPAPSVAAAKAAAAIQVAEAPAKAAAPSVDPMARVSAPAPAIAAPAVASGVSYAVADGDTLWSVAKRLGVSADALAAANPGVDPRRMSIGQRLAVPAGVDVAQVTKAQIRPSLPAASTKVHTVADGDNFWSVARQHGVTVAALTEANPGVDPTRLRIGQPLALPAAAATATAARPAAGKQHAALDGAGYVVADGDNFWSIAKRLGVSADDLTRLNAGLDPLRLQPGQVLAVPDNARAEALAAPAPAGNARTVSDAGLYPVAPGDTLWSLSRRFGVSLEDMLAVNGEVDPSRLRVGQLVTVPVEGGLASAEMLVFPVSAGDSLWSIAKRFDVSVEALAAANPGVDPLRLREGQTIRVPSSLAAVAASGAPAKQAPAKAASAAAPAILPAEAQDGVVPTMGPATAPTAGPAHAPARQHVISEGDNLWKLSRAYGLSVQRILAENGGLDPMRLRVGTVLQLPVGVASMAAR
jgi:LysM repeat protein/lysophospholipase L1-like esterase